MNAEALSWSGCFFDDPESKQVLLHLRDGNTKHNPHSWALFGGLSEAAETPVECLIREVSEELGVTLQPQEVKHLHSNVDLPSGTKRHVFCVTKQLSVAQIDLQEGADIAWHPYDRVASLKLAKSTRQDLNQYFKPKHSG